MALLYRRRASLAKLTCYTLGMKTAKKSLGKTFSERVLDIALSIPKGRVTTYGRIARAAGGGAMSSQSVTGILAKAYDEGKTAIPFHRIVYANGTIWIDEAHRVKRMKLYKEENIEIDKNNKIKNFHEKLFEFK
jgi:methylated-DNA-protein-cysteine methyltransferase related protein